MYLSDLDISFCVIVNIMSIPALLMFYFSLVYLTAWVEMSIPHYTGINIYPDLASYIVSVVNMFTSILPTPVSVSPVPCIYWRTYLFNIQRPVKVILRTCPILTSNFDIKDNAIT